MFEKYGFTVAHVTEAIKGVLKWKIRLHNAGICDKLIADARGITGYRMQEET